MTASEQFDEFDWTKHEQNDDEDDAFYRGADLRAQIHGADGARAIVRLARVAILGRVGAKDRKYVNAVMDKMSELGITEVMLSARDWKALDVTRQGGTKALERTVARSGGVLRRTKEPSSRSGRDISARFVKRGFLAPWFYQINRRALKRAVA